MKRELESGTTLLDAEFDSTWAPALPFGRVRRRNQSARYLNAREASEPYGRYDRGGNRKESRE